MNIVLIGYRGTGKSTIGRRLADKLWREFVDTDALVTARAGKTIREIFAAEGEAGFRELESAAVAEAAGRDEVVIAAGGGVVLRAENVAALKRNGKVIWLQADVATLAKRIAEDPGTAESRPSLLEGVGGGVEEIGRLLGERTPLYEGAADGRLDVSRLTVDEAVYQVTRMV